jgi:hypothetical protein
MHTDCYDPTTHPWAGSLCGGAGSPCSVLVDEAVDPDGYFRNDAPSVTHDDECTPTVMFSVAEGGFFGYLSTRTGADAWTEVETPTGLAAGAVAWDTNLDVLRILEGDGSTNIDHHTYDGAAFAAEPALPDGEYSLDGRAAASLGNGRWHVATSSYGGAAYRYGLFDGGSWMITNMVRSAELATAVSDVDEAHVGYYSGEGSDGWQYYYVAAPDGTPEVVFDYGSNALDAKGATIVTVGSQPHVIAQRLLGRDRFETYLEIVYAVRNAANDWTVLTLAADEPGSNHACGKPQVDGEMCNYEVGGHRPLGIVASHGGDVRLLWAEDHYAGTLVATCDVDCEWETASDTSEFTMWMSTPTDDGFVDQPVLDRNVVSLDAEVDGTGRIHIATYERSDSDGMTVGYLLLGE